MSRSSTSGHSENWQDHPVHFMDDGLSVKLRLICKDIDVEHLARVFMLFMSKKYIHQLSPLRQVTSNKYSYQVSLLTIAMLLCEHLGHKVKIIKEVIAKILPLFDFSEATEVN
jgi:hypothetical protein